MSGPAAAPAVVLRRVGLVVNAWPEPGGEPTGTGRNAQDIATELARRGIEVNVLVTTSSGDHWRSQRAQARPGIEVELLDLYRSSYRASYRSALGRHELESWLDRVAVDVVHVVHPGETGVEAPAVIAARGVPVVMTACDAYYGCHMGHLVNPLVRRALCELPVSEPDCAQCMSVGTGVDKAWMRPLAHERRVVAAVSVASGPIVSDSRFMGRQLTQAFPAADVAFLPWPVPPAPDDVEPTRIGPLTLGFFGVPSWRKGLDVLLQAVDGLDGVRLQVHGPTATAFEPGVGEDLTARAARMPNVEWVGGYQPAEAIGLMRSVDVVVVPSRAESLPGVVKEALAAGRPVLSTRVAGIPELVGEGTGWLVEADSSAALRAEIERLASDPAAVRAVRPSLDLPVAGYVDDLLAAYSHARQSVDAALVGAALAEATRATGIDPLVSRDERFQRGLVAWSGGRRAGVLDVARSLHRGAHDRLWASVTWLLWAVAPFERAFRQVRSVQHTDLGDGGVAATGWRWLRVAARPAPARGRQNS